MARKKIRWGLLFEKAREKKERETKETFYLHMNRKSNSYAQGVEC